MRKLIILFVLIVIRNVLTAGFWSRKLVKIDVLKNCEEKQNTPVLIQNPYFTKLHDFYAVSAAILVKEDLPKDQMMILMANRCNSKEALDTCEVMHPVSFKKVCVILAQKQQIWSSLLEKIEPKLDCPAKKGTYKMNNGTFDIRTISLFPLVEKYYWKVKVEVYDEEMKKLYLCVRMEGNVVST